MAICNEFEVTILSLGLSRAQNIITFDAPGAGTGAGQGTLAQGIIPPTGETFGYFVYPSGAAHGFLRTGNGTFAMFSAPEAGTNSGQGTFASSLNPARTITA
jgi:hypothetical protein